MSAGTGQRLDHLQSLEAESIHILREAAAEAERPVMLYAMGKDSAVMLHPARKAFYRAPPPFPLLHATPAEKYRDPCRPEGTARRLKPDAAARQQDRARK